MHVRKMSRHSVFAWLFMILLTLGLISCSQGGNEYLGKWHAPDIDLTITKKGESFVVDSRNPDGLLGGTFVGKLTEAGIQVKAGMAGDQLLTYSKDSDTLRFVGITFRRSK